jgi:hypothetical protein
MSKACHSFKKMSPRIEPRALNVFFVNLLFRRAVEKVTIVFQWFLCRDRCSKQPNKTQFRIGGEARVKKQQPLRGTEWLLSRNCYVSTHLIYQFGISHTRSELFRRAGGKFLLVNQKVLRREPFCPSTQLAAWTLSWISRFRPIEDAAVVNIARPDRDSDLKMASIGNG